MAPSVDAPQRPPEQKTGANRADVLPLLYTHEDDPLPPGSPEAPATLGMPNSTVPPSGTPNSSVPPSGTPNYSLPSSSITAGCAGRGCVSGPAPNLPIPTEKQMTTHPAYIIEPPDILLLQPVRLIPKPPYHVEPLDLLQIQVSEALPNQPVNGPFVVSPEGVVNLGFSYGVVRVGGLTIDQAAQAIKTQAETVDQGTAGGRIATPVPWRPADRRRASRHPGRHHHARQLWQRVRHRHDALPGEEGH